MHTVIPKNAVLIPPEAKLVFKGILFDVYQWQQEQFNGNDIASETELQAVQRELLEETGMTFGSWKLIFTKQPMNKIEQFVYIFVATDFVSQVESVYDNGEKISIKLVSFDEALELANSPKNRHLPREILVSAGSVENLKALPEVA